MGRLSSRIEAVASKLESAVQMNKVSAKMQKITQKLGPTMNAMSTLEVAKNMGDFESMFEDIDVRTAMMEDAIDGTTTTQIPEEQVAGLMQEVGEQHNLEVSHMLPTAPIGGGKLADKDGVSGLDAAGELSLDERLAKLRAE